MKKSILSMMIASAMLAGGACVMTSCGGAPAKTEVYTGYRMDAEAGFDELLFPVCEELALTGSNYVYSESTLLCHTLGKNIVATHLYNFSGTFEVVSEDKEEGTKTIKLSAPTEGIDKNTGTTLADDPELKDKFVIAPTVVLNVANYTATFTLAA